MKHRMPRLAPAIALVALSACEAATGYVQPSDEPKAPSDLQLPVVNVSLNRIMNGNDGLLTGVDGFGLPALDGPTMDPLIVEARRFYDTLKTPKMQPVPVTYPDPFTGENAPMRRTAPLTFNDWKVEFNFSLQMPGESLAAYRVRTNVVTYFNKNELGLGRELSCAEFPDGQDPNGVEIKGWACYVTNYGSVFRDQVNSLAEAVEGKYPRNTVAISWRPSMEPGYEVQFYVYGADGKRLDFAQLDTHGPRPVPHVCMNCHGGWYDEKKHLAKYARFLPLDPSVVVFPSGPNVPYDLTREGQEERIRLANIASVKSPLTPAQQELLHELYDGQILTPGAVAKNTWLPVAWRGNPEDEQLYDRVIKPYCATCHLASQLTIDGATLGSAVMFRSPADMKRFPLSAVLCGQFGMPNAQPTRVNFWDPQKGMVAVGGKRYPAAADALLAWAGLDRTSCNNLGEVASCDRGPDPDMLCGMGSSGTACNRETGRCIPEFSGMAAGQTVVGARGVCRTDGSRICPRPLECASTGNMPQGLSGFDGVCVPSAKK